MPSRKKINATNASKLAPLSAAIRATMPRKPLMLHALEQRYLFDAAAATTLGEAMSERVAMEQTDQAVAALTVPQVEARAASTDTSLALPVSFDAPDEANEIVFLDRRVADLDSLLADVAPSSELHLIDTNRDGLDQIQEVLAERPDVDRLQILAPGTAGEILLGTAILDAETIRTEHVLSLIHI